MRGLDFNKKGDVFTNLCASFVCFPQNADLTPASLSTRAWLFRGVMKVKLVSLDTMPWKQTAVLFVLFRKTETRATLGKRLTLTFVLRLREKC